jgi:hypothetical protein
MEASECFLYFLPEELREFEVCFFHFSRFGRCGGRLLVVVVTFFGPRGGFPVLGPLADSLAIFGPADVEVVEVGERSVAQKLKLVFYSDD